MSVTGGWSYWPGNSPVALLTEATLATDGAELLRPVLDGSAGQDVLAVAGGPDRHARSGAIQRPGRAVHPPRSAPVQVDICLSHGMPFITGTTEDEAEVAAQPGSVVRSEQVVGVFADVRDAESGGGGKQPAYSPLLSSRARILRWALRGRPALVVEH